MVERERCTGCGACAAVCSAGALTMRPDREGFFYPVLQQKKCTSCGACKTACPEKCPEPPAGERSCFGAYALAEETRRLGSSGGIFPLLAAHMLEQGGVVFGAALLPGGKVRHIAVQRREELPRITRTKYVQSDLGEVWQQLGPLLQAGRPVFFCGTPCQAAAVRARFGAPEGLVVADLICYGVPSPGVWARYVRLLECRHGAALEDFSFRDKRRGDNGHTCAYQIGGKEYVYPLHADLFCRSYFWNVNLRPSCFRCRYTTTRRGSDLTLGDFWGIEEQNPGFGDGLGCSAVLCHTPRGRQLWAQVQGRTRWFACTEAQLANESQPRLRTPTRPARRRGLYMGLYGWVPFRLWLQLFRR